MTKNITSRLNPFSRLKMHQKEAALGYVFLLPVFIVFTFVIFYPAVRALIDSFTNAGLYEPNPSFIWFDNFKALFSSSLFWEITLRTIVMVFIVVFLQYVLGLSLALLLNKELFGTRWMKNFILIPWVIPVASMVVMFDWMGIPKYGLANMILQNIGLGHITRYWFGDTAFAFPLVILMHVWRNMPFYALTLYAALKTIPQTLYEAAEVDGANKLSQFWHITLPNLKYQSMIVIILHILFTFNNFDIIYLSTGGGPVGKTEVLATRIYQLAWTNYEFGKASAMGMTMIVVMMVVSITYMNLVREH